MSQLLRSLGVGLACLVLASMPLPGQEVRSRGGSGGPPDPGSQGLAVGWATLAKTPPMGWNSWNKFGCDVSDTLVREVADALVSSGMRDAGYHYLVIDDCWQVDRDDEGRIVVDPVRFPNGMKPLADYVHSKGLKFGIYSDAGATTCQGRPGSNGYEELDAWTYAVLGRRLPEVRLVLQRGRRRQDRLHDDAGCAACDAPPIVFSMCEWGTSKPWEWARGVAHLWRTTGDILDCWDCTNTWGGAGWTLLLDKQVGLDKYAGPGGWNDPDMLQVGNAGLTVPESRAHFSMWSMLAAPLMAGNDVRAMSPDIREILTNPEVIAIDQDPLGRQGHKIRDDGDHELWTEAVAGRGLGGRPAEPGRALRTSCQMTWPQLGAGGADADWRRACATCGPGRTSGP